MKMNKLMMTAALAIMTATAARADDWMGNHFKYDTECKQAFNCNELSIDAFGSYQRTRNFSTEPNFETERHKELWGGGLGLTYFPIEFLGIGAESAAYSGTHNFFDY